MDGKLDFTKICRVCLNEGIMMSIFKVNVSKKIMACASVQVRFRFSKHYKNCALFLGFFTFRFGRTTVYQLKFAISVLRNCTFPVSSKSNVRNLTLSYECTWQMRTRRRRSSNKNNNNNSSINNKNNKHKSSTSPNTFKLHKTFPNLLRRTVCT